MRRETQYLILLLAGGAVLKISLNGMYARYVKPELGPWLAVSGAATVLLAAALIARSFRGGADEQEHGHRHQTRMGWLLMVPALALLFAPPPILTVDQRPSQAQAAPVESQGYAPLPPGQPQVKLLDFVGRALNAPGTLDGREVSLVGFVRTLPDGLYLARVFIWCCVADARAAVVKLDAPNAQGLSDKQWVRVVATYVPGSVHADPDSIPTVRVVDVEPIPEPQDPYEH
ncbi:TIGR03943 family putative permease subunit [Segniliparus rugosus]|uniref:TIGR03943 family protein n=1 Tax=Segniliparus rugosus (strain ATCC BAA-974 / DSM 45345 / CCUG 50838 / CIP 108380 / JCM 13579 / CDC 945) TaxID=679197 RepID=E5XQ96_SEGRC|nr:TIGR03943 family protein [Segniliparus rugosus]EFV13458.1 TIGR03943 family protein [Segniliparus rugosus ATCC BAA-974]